MSTNNTKRQPPLSRSKPSRMVVGLKTGYMAEISAAETRGRQRMAEIEAAKAAADSEDGLKVFPPARQLFKKKGTTDT